MRRFIVLIVAVMGIGTLLKGVFANLTLDPTNPTPIGAPGVLAGRLSTADAMATLRTLAATLGTPVQPQQMQPAQPGRQAVLPPALPSVLTPGGTVDPIGRAGTGLQASVTPQAGAGAGLPPGLPPQLMKFAQHPELLMNMQAAMQGLDPAGRAALKQLVEQTQVNPGAGAAQFNAINRALRP